MGFHGAMNISGLNNNYPFITNYSMKKLKLPQQLTLQSLL